MSKHTALATLLAVFPALAANVTVDAAHDRHPISPLIYGLIGGDDAQLSRMGVTLRRHGGNQLSRYNWKLNTTNSGGDEFYFQRQPARSVDDFVTQTKAAGAQSLIELPTIGWVSKGLDDGANHCGYAVTKYGNQQAYDPADPGCGNGVKPDGMSFVLADPTDVSVPADEGWAGEWVSHLVTTFGAANAGGVSLYQLGNQPALWNETHRDVHPQPATYKEITDKLEAYGKAVKTADPTAQTLGPGAWGWLEYFDSAAQDRESSGVDFIPAYLQAAHTDETKYGHRLLDYLDIHIYPQAPRISAGSTTEADNAMRLRSTRILWDPNYTVESWESCCYGGILDILPRMHHWIDTTYPGTRLAVSGYDFGAIDAPNGAITQALVLGIFGREKVDLAALETPPMSGSIGEDAFKLYRNYDGMGGQYGDTSVRAVSDAPNDLQSFAAFTAGGKVTVVLVNTNPVATTTANLTFNGMGDGGPWRAFVFGAAGRLAPAGNGDVKGGKLAFDLKAGNAALIEFTPNGGVGMAAPDDSDGGTVTGPNHPGCGCDFVDAGVWLLGMIPVWLFRRKPKKVAVQE